MIVAVALALVTQAELPASEADPTETSTAIDAQVEELQRTVAGLEDRVNELERRRVDAEARVRFSGYVDFGFFWANGNDGSGVIEDFGNRLAPELGSRWVFLGDLLARPVNSRGEPADLGDLPGVARRDAIDSGGAPSFILNEVNFSLNAVLTANVIGVASVNVVPRSGREFDLGDFIDLDLAQLEWVVDEDRTISLFAGKIEPVVGFEYRERRANGRFGVTPSLLARYTNGTPLGLKVRAKLFDSLLIVAASLTNSNAGMELFHFYDETDVNAGKTGALRISTRLPLSQWSPVLSGSLEIGVAGEIGAQSHARSSDGVAWLIGADFRYAGPELTIKGQWLMARAPGDAIDQVYSLDVPGAAFAELNYLASPELGILFRAEVRHAQIAIEGDRLYRTEGWRLTFGARWLFLQDVALKVEYLLNGEFGIVPDFDNDVLTTSLVLSY